jgi:ribosomal-protein-alanine N-acetyltransferase
MALIRPADHADLFDLERIEKRSFTTPHWKAANFLVYDCAVAEVDAHVAGFLVSRIVFAGDENIPSEQEILNLAVDPQYRRKGIASALLHSTLRNPATRFFLEVRESNAAARHLYERFGFREVGQRPEYYSDPTETAIVMRLK